MVKKKIAVKKKIVATVSVEWGYELHEITVSPSDWDQIKAGKEVCVIGEGYRYEGEFFWDYWYFGGGRDGSLLVEYERKGDVGVGYDGDLNDASVVEHELQPTKR